MCTKQKDLDVFHLSVLMHVFCHPKLKRSFVRILKARFPQTYGYIDARYPQLDKRRFTEKCYWLMHGYEDFPRCPVCGNPICSYKNIIKGYALTCSSKCSNAFKQSKHMQYPYFYPSEKLDDVFRSMLSQLNLDFHHPSYKNTIIKAYPYVWNYICFRYAQLSGHKMPEKVYWFIHSLHDFPKCQTCGKPIVVFRNAAIGYSTYCDGCCYNDPQHRHKISQSWQKHKSEDPNFIRQKTQKGIDTRIKNGHNPNWNNREKAKQTIEDMLKEDPEFKKNIVQKGKQTKKERYGNENYNNSEQARLTCIDRYGVDSFSKTDEFLEK